MTGEAGHSFVTADRGSAFAAYRRAVGGQGTGRLLLHELVSWIDALTPGYPGFALRRLLYPLVLGASGRGVVFGAGMSLRRPGACFVGDDVLFDDGVALLVKGDGARIEIGEGARVGWRTILSCRGGTLSIAPRAVIGRSCRVGSLGGLFIGEGARLEDGCCLAGGGHSTERLDLPVVQQPLENRGPISIGRGAIVGEMSVVLGGLSIGEGAVVGPRSLVNRDVPPGARAAGVPLVIQS